METYILRWLLVQTGGEHKENLFLRECFAWKHGLENCGQEAVIWGPRHSNFKEFPDIDSFDVVFMLEQYELTGMAQVLKLLPLPKIQWIVDMHYTGKGHYAPITAECDVIVHTTSDYISKYRNTFPTKKHVWLPNAVDDRYFVNKGLSRKVDVAFIGSMNEERQQWMRELKHYVGMEHGYKLGFEYIDELNHLKIHWNKAHSNDLNYRVFETIGTGTCLCTDYQPDLTLLGFVDMLNCIMYKDLNECVKKIRLALQTDLWQSIGMAGQILSQTHTYTVRAEELITYLNKELGWG
jgi:hypothetical protein